MFIKFVLSQRAFNLRKVMEKTRYTKKPRGSRSNFELISILIHVHLIEDDVLEYGEGGDLVNKDGKGI